MVVIEVAVDGSARDWTTTDVVLPVMEERPPLPATDLVLVIVTESRVKLLVPEVLLPLM